MPTPELSIIVPTYNERGNIEELVSRLAHVLADCRWEVIFVDDDSPDGTADLVASLARSDCRVRCLRRIGRRGLSSASIEGMASSAAPFLAVMDADLQHDETVLPEMLRCLKEEGYDIAVGSRYVRGGSVGNWTTGRRFLSRAGTVVAQKLIHSTVTDPMSGFFILRREAFLGCVRQLSGQGFKILLDLLASSPTPLKIVERPYVFRPRRTGETKLDIIVALEYATLLLDKLVGHILPLRFMMFVLVGCTGVVLHLSVLSGLHLGLGYSFWVAQAAASACSMVLNFGLNNMLTYRDRRLRGRQFLLGLLLFILVCSVGAFTNVQVAVYLFRRNIPWWLAGLLGAGIGAVWNYAVSSQFVWGARMASKRGLANT